MDLSVAKKLEDSRQNIDIENHFKLVAGPGAGKTTFLINHIKNILANSMRLSKTKKVACITYTNVGVETIISRLDNSIDNVEVGTIHHFLYNNIIKPYLWVLEDEFEFSYKDIDGHDEVIPTHSLLDEWMANTNQKYFLGHDKELIRALTHLSWEMKEENFELNFSEFYYGKIGNYNIKSDSLLEYKKTCWKYGAISHDDVLYLSYRIINKEPKILEVIRAKFPYLLVDEFQDTNPIQTYIMLKIAEKETIVGVIGDEWQSIFEFQGANIKDFENFNLEGLQVYKLENNHRSTQQIIDVLNDIRNDEYFKQVSIENRSGDKPYILVGNFFDAYSEASKICKDEKLYTLTFVNKISNVLKYKFEENNEELPEDLILKLRTFDGERGKLILNIIYSIEYCKQNKLKEAIKYMKKAYRKVVNFDDRNALQVLHKLISSYDEFLNINIKDFYMNNIYDLYKNESKIQGGNKAKYYSELSYKRVSVAIKLDNDDNSLYKTIHKSKGDEFDNVLLVMSQKYDSNRGVNLDFLLNSDRNNEKDRLYYVAFSRAKKRLFINVPKLDDELIKQLSRFQVDYANEPD